jgi:uncharacterized protein YfkK (UPF0435 family)
MSEVNVEKVGVFNKNIVDKIGFEKFWVLVRKDNEISKEACQLIACLPVLVEGIEVEDLERSIEQIMSEVDVEKVGVFNNWKVKEIGLEKFLVLVRKGNEISVETCRLVASNHSLVLGVEASELVRLFAQKK